MKIRSQLIIAGLLTLVLGTVMGQTNGGGQQGLLLGKVELKPVVALQLWSTYTLGTEQWNSKSGEFIPVDDRLNFLLRRSRIGVKGNWGEDLKFNLVGAADLVGKDDLSGVEASANNGGSPKFRLWTAEVSWRFSQLGDWLTVTAGFFSPRIGRESMTSAFQSLSMEKAWSQNYLRRHLVGTGPGRSTGVNIGGLSNWTGWFNIGYDVGIFNPEFEMANRSTGTTTGPLFVGRAEISLGDRERASYRSGYKLYIDGRRGLSLGGGAAFNKGNDQWGQSTTYSVDMLFNFGDFIVDGDVSWLGRKAVDAGEQVNAMTGYIRAGHFFKLNNGGLIQPGIMLFWLSGEEEMDLQILASEVSMPSGSERGMEFSISYYINRRIKLTAAYTLRDGDNGEAIDGFGNNNYFMQSGIGAIRRGDWIGLGLSGAF